MNTNLNQQAKHTINTHTHTHTSPTPGPDTGTYSVVSHKQKHIPTQTKSGHKATPTKSVSGTEQKF